MTYSERSIEKKQEEETKKSKIKYGVIHNEKVRQTRTHMCTYHTAHTRTDTVVTTDARIDTVVYTYLSPSITCTPILCLTPCLIFVTYEN